MISTIDFFIKDWGVSGIWIEGVSPNGGGPAIEQNYIYKYYL